MMDERDDRESTAAPGTTRRRLLRATAGGFALAASGLFLPAGREETAAREGALGGAKGGRREKDHNGRHRHRSHGDKKDKNKGKDDRTPGAGAPGGSLIRYVALRAVAGDLAPSTISVDFYFRVKRGLNEFGPLVFAQSAEGLKSGNADYAPARYSIAAYIRGDALPTPVFIEYANTLFNLSYGRIAKGGAVDSNGQYVGGATLYSGNLGIPSEFDLGKWTDSVVERDMKLRVEGLDVNVSDTHYWLQPTIQWRK